MFTVAENTNYKETASKVSVQSSLMSLPLVGNLVIGFNMKRNLLKFLLKKQQINTYSLVYLINKNFH